MPQFDLALAPQHGAHRAAILFLPAQIEADILPHDVGDAVRSLWRDPAAQEALRRLHEFQPSDSAVYYFDAIDRMSLLSYLPTDQHILCSCVKTTGIAGTVQGRRVDVQIVWCRWPAKRVEEVDSLFRALRPLCFWLVWVSMIRCCMKIRVRYTPFLSLIPLALDNLFLWLEPYTRGTYPLKLCTSASGCVSGSTMLSRMGRLGWLVQEWAK